MHSQEKQILIDSLSDKGRGVSSNHSFEVPGALPEEEVLIELGPRRRKKRIGYLREVVTPSSSRVKPRCSHVPDCGGCAFQQLDYSAQLLLKQKRVEGLFDFPVDPIIGCDDPWHYRNKMEFSFSQNKAGDYFLGLMLAGGKGRVGNVSNCSLASSWFSKTLQAVRAWWESSDLQAYHHRSDQGHLRTLTLREAKQGEGKMAMLTVSGNPDFALKREEMNQFIEAVKGATPEGSLSVFIQIQQIAKGRPTQFFEMLVDGPDHITERLSIALNGEIHTLDFKISPTSFFQPNTLQAQKLYSAGLGMLTLEGARVFDLYCGGATLGLAAAKVAKEVVGIERNPHSVFDAGWNQEVNEIDNFSIERGDVGEKLKEWEADPDFVPPDVVIVDPPRMGLDQTALTCLKKWGAPEILYISCNPKTQAENVLELIEAGYVLKKIQPVDQFPHTYHIENICLLTKSQ